MQWCSSLPDMLRIHQKRLNDSRNRTRPIRRFGFTSVPNHNGMLASHRARNVLKKSKEHLMKHMEILSGQLKQAQGKMQSMSTEGLNEKLEALKLSWNFSSAGTKQCVSAARCRSKEAVHRALDSDMPAFAYSKPIRLFISERQILPLPCVTTV